MFITALRNSTTIKLNVNRIMYAEPFEGGDRTVLAFEECGKKVYAFSAWPFHLSDWLLTGRYPQKHAPEDVIHEYRLQNDSAYADQWSV